MEPGGPIFTLVAALVGGVALIALSRYARGLPEPTGGFVRLSLGDVSFTEIAGMFLIGYAIGTLVAGMPTEQQSGPPAPPVGVGRRFIGVGFGGGLRGGLPATTGMAFALLTLLYRVDILSRIGTPGSAPSKSVHDIIGTDAKAAEDIPAGGHGQITYRDALGRLQAVVAASDVDVPRGASVRIVGTKGLNPLITPALRTDAPQNSERSDRGSRLSS